MSPSDDSGFWHLQWVTQEQCSPPDLQPWPRVHGNVSEGSARTVRGALIWQRLPDGPQPRQSSAAEPTPPEAAFLRRPFKVTEQRARVGTGKLQLQFSRSARNGFTVKVGRIFPYLSHPPHPVLEPVSFVAPFTFRHIKTPPSGISFRILCICFLFLWPSLTFFSPFLID